MNDQFFNLPAFDDETPYALHWVCLYMAKHYGCKSKTRDGIKPDIEYIMDALNEMGFVEGKDKIEYRQMQYALDAIRIWFDHTPWFNPCRIEELFKGDVSHCKAGIINCNSATDKLKEMTAQSGFIYDVTPEHCYFSIINGQVFARYQRIIGSRRICKIEV